LKFEFMLLRF